MKFFFVLTLLFSSTIFAQDIRFENITKSDVEKVTKEFGGNFAHTAVAAPETNGLWGIEAGFIGGTTRSPEFSDVVENSGGNGSDFKSIYHLGLMLRAHFPFDLFIEGTVLPEQKFSDVKVKNRTMGLGWNFGSFFQLPLDLAAGIDLGTGNVKFTQEAQGLIPEADIKLETKTTVYWLGASRTFLFFTPYVKVGISKMEGDLNASTAQIFDQSLSAKQRVNTSGGYFALGGNFQLAVFKIGLEGSQIQDTRRITGKLSLDF